MQDVSISARMKSGRPSGRPSGFRKVNDQIVYPGKLHLNMCKVTGWAAGSIQRKHQGTKDLTVRKHEDLAA